MRNSVLTDLAASAKCRDEPLQGETAESGIFREGVMNALVGYTGFVGSNIYAAGNFDYVFNSGNIEKAYGLKPDLLVYAGMRAEKYLANSAPEKDMELVTGAEENISRIGPKKLVLISTIDIFKEPKNVDEKSEVDTVNLHPYGYHRYQLELWARENYPDALIIRLPGLFGKNIKKNFIYDFMHYIPFMLNRQKMEEVSSADGEIRKYYQLQENGFYKLGDVPEKERMVLKDKFRKIGFSALHFTDSRSRYQFYNLGRLWEDIQTALKEDIRLWHPATEPVSAGEVYRYLTGEEFTNELGGKPADYDYRTVFGEIFGGKNGYICDKNRVLEEIKSFVSRAEAEGRGGFS